MQFIRLLFILALLANIGLYIYSRQHQPKQAHFTAVDKGVQKLVLLSELDAENTLWEAQQETEGDDKTTTFNQECFSVGVFNAKSEISPVFDELKDQVIKIRTRKVTSTHEAGYWVTIPSAKTREKALGIVRQLYDYQVKDFYVVTGGENENIISLGVYRDKKNADSRLQELLSKGFKAEKQIRIEQWPEFWLDYVIAADNTKDLTDIKQINPDVSTNKVECNW